MFCPLCKSEYRDGVTRCESCLAELVDSLEALDDPANSAVNFWAGKDDALFDVLTGALLAAEIPSHSEGQPQVSVHRKWLPESRISVLLPDFERAVEAVKPALPPLERNSCHASMCFSCREMILPGFARCYKCGTVLDVPAEAEPLPAMPAPRRCPVCGLTYRANYVRCTRCGVKLASRVDPNLVLSDSGRSRDEKLLVVWKGGDPAAFSRVEGALRGASIAHHSASTRDHLAFGIGLPRPMYEVRVLQPDFEAAKQLIAPIQETLPFEVRKSQPREGPGEGPREGGDLSPTLRSAASPSQSATRGSRETSRYPERNLAEATVQVWSGDDPAVGNMLCACFFENRILLRIVGTAPGQREFYVCPEQAAAALEIVREITEGKVPE